MKDHLINFLGADVRLFTAKVGNSMIVFLPTILVKNLYHYTPATAHSQLAFFIFINRLITVDCAPAEILQSTRNNIVTEINLRQLLNKAKT